MSINLEDEEHYYWKGFEDAKQQYKEHYEEQLNLLRDKCDFQANILRRLMPDKFPNTYFIHGELGSKDQNGMPEKIMVVPAYGVDFSYIYTREEKTVGPEW
jgi:hypothetical protein